MVSKTRIQKIEERIFEELSTILHMDVSDPRLATVSITKVHVDRELVFANIYVSSIEGSEAADEIINGLLQENADGFIFINCKMLQGFEAVHIKPGGKCFFWTHTCVITIFFSLFQAIFLILYKYFNNCFN